MNIYLPKIHQAIKFATKVHQGQVRKGKNVPYIVHPLTVAIILSRVTQDEDIIIAGILHDTIEDCNPHGSVTKENIEAQFGQRVAQMVDDVTEKDKTLPWLERKLQALEHIGEMGYDSLLVKSADVLHNLSELINDIEIDGVGVLNKFNAGPMNVIIRYQKLIPRIADTWPENPLNSDLKNGLQKLLELVDGQIN